MKKRILCVLFSVVAGLFAADEAIIAAWDFSQKEPVASGSTRLVLRGGSVIQDGLLICSNEDKTKPSGAVVKLPKGQVLSPAGAFSCAVTFKLGANWKTTHKSHRYFYDSKYVLNKDKYHKGFAFMIIHKGGESYVFVAAFGFGDKSAQVSSKAVTLKNDVLHTAELRFSATGKVSYIVDGVACGGGVVPVGVVVPSAMAPVIGDRVGSDYCPLGGAIQKVVLKELTYEPVAICRDTKTRTVFERGEKGKSLHYILNNLALKEASDIRVAVNMSGKNIATLKLGAVAPGQTKAFDLPVDTLMLPGNYKVTLAAEDGNGKKLASDVEEFTIVPAYGDFLPVVLWGGGDIKTVADIGFTHQVCGIFSTDATFYDKNIAPAIQRLDDNLKGGLYVFAPYHIHRKYTILKKYLRKDRSGKLYPRLNVEASNPAVRRETAAFAEAAAMGVGEHPAWDGVLSSSEVRDGSNPSFTGVEEAAFKAYAGYDIPSSVTGRYPRPYETYADLPWNRVLPDNHPLLVYYSWFWRTGDGWNDLHTLVSESMHKHIKHHFWTFYDPVVRVPPQWGSGGKVDAVNQWTYTCPDPIKIGQATDEVIAMAQGCKGQKPMSMTQIIWYRTGAAPIGQKVDNPPAWVKALPEAKFYTIPPDCIREALWCKVSRRLDGIQYHGVQSLLPNMKHASYRFTNGETKESLKEVLHRVVKPLGPVLKSIPERDPQVAILESFASTIFAPQHASLGWSRGWIADLHLALQWNHFQPVILYEEHLLNNMQGKDLKVLFVPGLEVVTEKVAARLSELQAQGVILVGDEFTSPGVSLDFRIKSVHRLLQDPIGSKSALQKLGKDIARMLAPYYTSPMEATSQEIVVRRRGSDGADYVFLVNDKRTFGDYVGQWKMVMEKGLPESGTVTVNHTSAAAYDLVNNKPYPFRNIKGKTVFDVSLAPCDGALILLTDRKIASVEMRLPVAAQRGGTFEATFQVRADNGQMMKAILPLQIVMTASDGTQLPGSGYYAARDGQLVLKEIMATNMKPGPVKVLVKDLASGIQAKGTFTVR